MRRLLPAAVLLPALGFAFGITGGCTTTPTVPAVVTARPPVAIAATVRVRSGGQIVAVPLEEYVLGTALSEVSPVGEPAATVERIFEVQAVLARTYALAHLDRHARDGFDLCDTTHCQLYEPARIGASRFTEAARQAVARTRGVILVYGNRPVDAVFHADCGGHTASAADVWGGPAVPYLIGSPDEVPSETHRTWDTTLSLTQVRNAVASAARAAIGARVKAVRVAARDDSGRATEIEIRGERAVTVRSEQFRASVNDALGPKAIQSTRFDVTRVPAGFRFSGTGYGHGVGLCQVGAAARARRGESLEEILAAYFPGALMVRGDEE